MRCAEAKGSLRPAQDEFALRYYRWSVRASDAELHQGFPRVSRVKSYLVFLFLDFAAGCTAAELGNLMRGGIKRFNPRGAELARESPTGDEDAIHQKFVAYFSKEIVIYGQVMKSMRIAPRAMEIQNETLAGRTSLQLNKKQLLRTVGQTLEPLLSLPERSSRSGLHYCLGIPPWHLLTSIDLGGRKQLTYSHWLSPRRGIDDCATDLSSGVSLLNWCGIHRSTAFDLIQDNEIESLGELLRDVCEYFIKSLPDLLSGLDHNIPETLEDSKALQVDAE